MPQGGVAAGRGRKGAGLGWEKERAEDWAGPQAGLGCFGLIFKFGVLGRVARVWVGLTGFGFHSNSYSNQTNIFRIQIQI